MATLVSIFPYCVFIYSCVYIILAVHALMISESETQSRDEARGCGAQLDYLRLVMVASARYKFEQRMRNALSYFWKSYVVAQSTKGAAHVVQFFDIAQPSCNRSSLHF